MIGIVPQRLPPARAPTGCPSGHTGCADRLWGRGWVSDVTPTVRHPHLSPQDHFLSGASAADRCADALDAVESSSMRPERAPRQRNSPPKWPVERAHINRRRTKNEPWLSPLPAGLDDPRSSGNTARGPVRTCGSGRSLGRDRQVNAVRGCVGLLADSDFTATHQRRHRRYAGRWRPLTATRSGGEQRHARHRGARTTPSVSTPTRHSQLTKAVRRISALLRSHQQPLRFEGNQERKRRGAAFGSPTSVAGIAGGRQSCRVRRTGPLGR